MSCAGHTPQPSTVLSAPQLPQPALGIGLSWHSLCRWDWGQGWTLSLSTWHLRACMGQARPPRLRAKRVEGQAQTASRTFLAALLPAARLCVCLSVHLAAVGGVGTWGTARLVFSELYIRIVCGFFVCVPFLAFLYTSFFFPPPHNFGFCGFNFSLWVNVSRAVLLGT